MTSVERLPEIVLPPQGFVVVREKSDFTPQEILTVREEPINDREVEVWRKCIDQALMVVGVREKSSQQLAGVGMLVGNQRHAELVDGTVHSAYRGIGLHNVMLSERIAFARLQEIKYLGITYDKSHPWLEDVYKRHGFRVIDFAMWHESSLPGSES